MFEALTQKIEELQSRDLDSLSLEELLKLLDEFIAQSDPMTHKSLKPPATDAQLKKLAKALGLEKLPSEVETWFRWHNGQSAEPRRYLTPAMNYLQPLSTQQAINLTKKATEEENRPTGWIPLLAQNSDLSSAIGFYTCGQRNGQLDNLRDESETKALFASPKSFVLALIEKFVDGSKPLPAGQYWVHGLPALLVELNHWFHTLPGGLWPTSSADCALSIFQSYWSIYFPEQLHSTLEWLENEGHREGAKNPEKYLAFDLCRASFLAAMGRVIGWLSAQESWAIQLRAAQAVQKQFTSWEQMLDSYEAGLKKFLGMSGKRARYLLTEEFSPFALPWNTPLSSEETPDPPTNELSLDPSQYDEFNEALGRQSSPRLLRLKLEPGYYSLDTAIQRASHILGDPDDETVIQGITEDRSTIRGKVMGLKLENLTITHEREDGSGDAPALRLENSVVQVLRCQLEGSGTGIVVPNYAFVEVIESKVKNGANEALLLGGSILLRNADVESVDRGALVEAPARLWAYDSVFQCERIGIKIEGEVRLQQCAVTSGKSHGLSLVEGGSLHVQGGRVRSRESDAVAALRGNNAHQPAVFLTDTELAPSSRSLFIGAGFSAVLERVTCRDNVLANEGRLLLRECILERTVLALKKGLASLYDSKLDSGTEIALAASKEGLIRAVRTEVKGGVRAESEAAVRLSHCQIGDALEGNNVNALGGHIHLNSCEVLHSKEAYAILAEEGAVSAIDCRFVSPSKVTVAVLPASQVHLFKCELINEHEEGMALACAGKAELSKCRCSAEIWGAYFYESAEARLHHSEFIGKRAPYQYHEGAQLLENPDTSWRGLSQLKKTKISLSLAEVDKTVAELLLELGSLEQGAAVLAQRVAALLAAECSVSVKTTDGELILSSRKALPCELNGYLSQAFTEVETAAAVLWTIELPEEERAGAVPFSVGQVHKRQRGAAP